MNNLAEPIHYQNSQWAVTAYGLETVGEPYHYYIPKVAITDIEFRHLLEKTWIDFDAWLDAFVKAMEHFEYEFEGGKEKWLKWAKEQMTVQVGPKQPIGRILRLTES